MFQMHKTCSKKNKVANSFSFYAIFHALQFGLVIKMFAKTDCFIVNSLHSFYYFQLDT